MGKHRRSRGGGDDEAETAAAGQELSTGTTVAQPQQPTIPSEIANGERDSRESSSQTHSSVSLKRSAPDDDEGWTKVERGNKKRKKVPREGSNNYPAITFSPSAKLFAKINLAMLRDLVLYLFADGTGPNWVSVSHRPYFRKIVVLMVPGLEEAMFNEAVNFEKYTSGSASSQDRTETTPDDYYPRPLSAERLPIALQGFANMFPHLWPVKAPGDDKYMKLHSPMGTFLTAPMSKNKDERKGPKPAREPSGWKNERTRITEFLATLEELETAGHLIHPALIENEERRAAFRVPDGWVVSKVDKLEDGEVPEADIEQGSVTAGRECLALDCEMCMTGESEYSLTRISVISWSGDLLMDELVKPEKPITNYVTQFSGITEEMLKPVTTTLQDIQQKLLELITPRTILIGHSLESDLKALHFSHPFIVDTSLIYPHPRGPPLKSSLKWLTQKYVNREIQKGGANGHNPIEDARACLDLVRQKCEKGKMWGASDSQGENLFRRLARAGTAYKAQGGEAGGLITGKTSAAVDWGDPSKGPGAGATYQIGCKSDADVVSGVIRAVKGDADGLEIPGGGVDFVWGRMRELEALQGWWNKNRVESANSDGGPPDSDTKLDEKLGKSPLEQCLARLSASLETIHASLPPCTAFIVYSGSGDPREMSRLQAMHTQWKREYNTPGKKWDQLSVKWTDEEEQALRRAVKKARQSVGFIGVK
ncbi:exonuclease [Colletotrichum higginsianum]|uniref:Exonuclease n=2 Tax=Colletotrichum higginsianum TaxID=80884 RepID=H1UZ62_COLHI|nr:Exonuclease [Colletotrichum higginsianum IMI 349063]OBR04938.1 Exonuclease [Colletotrichum higginsianum IMI 349063]TIC93870.1 putative exonuclease [Colletotrichum higginsianum]CCF33263.1 exonuclease [Colletotrichum higginsianum]